MLKRTITYTDFQGVERKEDFYFNLTKAELMMLNLNEEGGLQNKLESMLNEMNVPGIAATFNNIILKAYGKPSPDGRRFIKSEELSKEFSETEAYSQLFMELLSDSDSLVNFVAAIVPKDVGAQVMKNLENNPQLKALRE